MKTQKSPRGPKVTFIVAWLAESHRHVEPPQIEVDRVEVEEQFGDAAAMCSIAVSEKFKYSQFLSPNDILLCIRSDLWGTLKAKVDESS